MKLKHIMKIAVKELLFGGERDFAEMSEAEANKRWLRFGIAYGSIIFVVLIISLYVNL